MLSKISRLIVSALALAVVIYYHNEIVTIGLKLRLPFTYSMLLPYVIEFFFVCSLLFQFYFKTLGSNSIGLRRIVALVILFGGCGIAYMANPIQNNDFNNIYRPIKFSNERSNIFEKGFTVVVKPNCNPCIKKLKELKIIKGIYPQFPVHILILNGDENDATDDNSNLIVKYRKIIGADVQIHSFPDSPIIKSTMKENYPYVFYNTKTPSNKVKQWNNKGFGYPAWDYLLNKENL